MKLLLAAALCAVMLAGAQSASAADLPDAVTDMQALRAAVKSDKKAFVAATLRLTDAEAKRFWPIYDAYQRNLDLTSRRRVVAVEPLLFRDKAMTNLGAKNFVTELMAVDDAELKSRRMLRNRVMRALPPLKAARYLQLEEKIQAVRDYDLATTVPLVH